MSLTEYGDSFLLAQFREFYRELIRLERMVKTGALAPISEWGPEEDLEQPGDSNVVWQTLLSILERQALRAGQSGGTYGYEIYREAQYVMATLADEIFLHIEWEGKRAWTSNLLESRLFQTHAGGEIFFQKLDRLLQNRDPVYIDLAAVYFLALSLGFKGKFRGKDDRGQIARYRRQLYSFIFHRHPDLLSDSKHIFPEAYAHTLQQASRRRLPDSRLWIGVLALIILVWIAISHGLWVHLTGRLNEVNSRISEVQKELDKMR